MPAKKGMLFKKASNKSKKTNPIPLILAALTSYIYHASHGMIMCKTSQHLHDKKEKLRNHILMQNAA